MSISQDNFVDITSGVGGASQVVTRNLNARLFTTNPLVPTGSFVSFSGLDAVGSYFGTTSEEYKRAAFYFGWVSKSITKDQSISFARWNDTATAPLIFGAKGIQSLGAWTAITNGAFSLEMGGVTNLMSAMNFSGAANLAAVAAIIQAAIRTKTGTMWTAATVVYNAARGSFDLAGGVTGPATISVQAGTGGTDIAAQAGWLDPVNTILSQGSAIQTISACLAASADASNNFGSFLFMPTLTTDQITEAATWNVAQNVKFLFSVRCLANNAAALAAAIGLIGGSTITLAPLASEYPEQVPMMIEGATDYDALNSTKNYMYQQFVLTPSVTDDTAYALYKGLRINFYGQTQQAGRPLQFYMEGVMNGLATDPLDQNTYVNELWLKDAMFAAIMNLLLAMEKISANAKGRSQLMAIVLSVVSQALLNGVISVGKPLTQVQKLFIAEITGDAKAWYQVQNQGFWLDVKIVFDQQTARYKAIYTLVYSKDDVIRKVEGRDVLI